MDDDTPDVPVPIAAKSVELNQLHDWAPRVVERLERAELDDRANEIRSIYEDHIDVAHEEYEDDGYTAYVSMAPDTWITLVRSFQRIADTEGVNRVWWLQRKLLNRLNDKLGELDNE